MLRRSPLAQAARAGPLCPVPHTEQEGPSCSFPVTCTRLHSNCSSHLSASPRCHCQTHCSHLSLDEKPQQQRKKSCKHEFFFFSFCLSFFFFFLSFFCNFLGRSHGIWRFPGQGYNWSHSHWPTPEPQQRGIQATSSTYTTAHGNTRSLAH